MTWVCFIILWIWALVDSHQPDDDSVSKSTPALFPLPLCWGSGERDSSCRSLLCVAPPPPSTQSTLIQLCAFCSGQAWTTSNGPGNRGLLRAAMPGFSCLWIPQCCPCRNPVDHHSSCYALFVATSVQCSISQAKIAAILCVFRLSFFLILETSTHLCLISVPFCFIIAPFLTEGGQGVFDQGIQGHFCPLFLLI